MLKTNIFKAAKELKVNIHWFMTGTPMQNKIQDLYALFILLGFKAKSWGTPLSLENLLDQKMLRRTKKDVGIHLPSLKIYIKTVPWLTPEEKELSTQIHSAAGLATSQTPLQLSLCRLAAFVRSRQMCVCPKTIQLALGRENMFNFLEDINPVWDKIHNSKISYIVAKLVRRKNINRRKLVFCHYRREIDELASLLKQRNIVVNIVDGRTSTKTKNMLFTPLTTKKLWNELLPKFHTTRQIPIYNMVTSFLKPEVLLVQIQSSSEGLNLQDFCEVYFTSPHWNPALEDQAIARCHRYGQKKSVKVFRFVMESYSGMTLDKYCMQVQAYKRKLFKEVLTSP